MKLYTRRFLKKQEFNILRTSLKIEKTSLLDSSEYEIPFDTIHNKRRIQTNTNDNLLVISFSLLVIGLLFQFGSNTEVSITALIAGTFFLALALISFLLNKYGKIDRALPVEAQLNSLNFLRDRDVITDEEYDNLKNQLFGRENKGSLGFSR